MSALLLLLSVTCGTGFLHCRLGRWKVPIDAYPDTADYIAASYSDLLGLLGADVTPGYPLVLRVVALIDPAFSIMPLVNFAFYVFAVLVFAAGLSAYTGRRWPSTICAAALLLDVLLERYGGAVLTDVPASAFSIATVGWLLMALRGCGRYQSFAWLMIGLCSAAAYNIRPAFQFLLLLIPAMGLVLLLVRPPRPRAWGTITRNFLLLMTAVLLPAILLVSLRWAFVSQATLSSQAGMHLVGSVGQFLESDDLPALPREVIPLAQAALNRRAALAKWQTPRDGNGLNYSIARAQFFPTVADVYLPAAKQAFPGDAVSQDKHLMQLCQSLLKRHPVLYFQWLRASFTDALYRTGDLLAHHRYVPPLLLIVVLCVIMASVSRVFTVGVVECDPGPSMTEILFVIGSMYFLATVGVVIGVQRPAERYLAPAVTFVLPLLFAITTDALVLMRTRYGADKQSARPLDSPLDQSRP